MVHSPLLQACNQFENNGTCVTACAPEVIYNPDTFQLEDNPDYSLAAGDLCVEECPGEGGEGEGGREGGREAGEWREGGDGL